MIFARFDPRNRAESEREQQEDDRGALKREEGHEKRSDRLIGRSIDFFTASGCTLLPVAGGSDSLL